MRHREEGQQEGEEQEEEEELKRHTAHCLPAHCVQAVRARISKITTTLEGPINFYLSPALVLLFFLIVISISPFFSV